MFKALIFLIGLGIGLVFVIKTDNVVGITGRVAWAERKFGSTGTYTFYKLLGVFIIFCGAIYASGLVNKIIEMIFGFIFPTTQ